MATCQKRKYENRGFCLFAFIERSKEHFCFVFSTVLNHFKVSHFGRHYDTNHGHFHCEYLPESEIHSHKIKSLKSSAQCQMTNLTAFSKEADVATGASYAMACNIARSKCPYADGEFINKNILLVASILDRCNKKLHYLISQMALSSKLLYVELETSVPMLQCY